MCVPLAFAAATVTAVFDLIPDLFPFLAPAKRAAAGGTQLNRQVLFLNASHGLM
jgi:hypothetical protein